MNEERFIEIFTEAMEDIMSRVANVEDLTQRETLEELTKSIIDVFIRLGIKVEKYLPQLIEDSYNGGISEATKAVKEVLPETIATGVTGGEVVAGATALTAAQKGRFILDAINSKSTVIQKRVHLEALREIVGSSFDDLQAAIDTAKDKALASFEEVRKSMAKGILDGEHSKRITKQVQKNFADNGLRSFRVTTKAGQTRWLPLDFYARTVTRTKIRDAHTKGSINRYAEAGVNLVQVFGNSVTCPVCSKYRGMVFSIDEPGKEKGFPSIHDNPDPDDYKRINRLPPYHPNCYCTSKPYVKEFKSVSQIESDRNKWKGFKPEEDTRTAAQKKQYAKEQAIRREANEEKKQYMRWQGLLGAEAPKTLGAFRRMKRANTPKFQELQHMVRSNARIKI